MSPLDPPAWMPARALLHLEQAQGLRRQFFAIGQAGRGPLWEPPVDMADGGLSPVQLEVTDAALAQIVRYDTREAVAGA